MRQLGVLDQEMRRREPILTVSGYLPRFLSPEDFWPVFFAFGPRFENADLVLTTLVQPDGLPVKSSLTELVTPPKIVNEEPRRKEPQKKTLPRSTPDTGDGARREPKRSQLPPGR